MPFSYNSEFILCLRILFFPLFSIDQRRISKKQDGLIPCCMVHQEFGNSSNKGQENWAKNCLSFCANLVRIKAFKVSKRARSMLCNSENDRSCIFHNQSIGYDKIWPLANYQRPSWLLIFFVIFADSSSSIVINYIGDTFIQGVMFIISFKFSKDRAYFSLFRTQE